MRLTSLPLRAIKGFSRLLIESHAGDLPAEAARYLELVRNNAGQTGQLVDDLLHFSRLGRQSLQKQKVDLSDLVRQVLNELQSEQEGREIEILIGEQPEVQADAALLKVVYSNLISNALKYTRGRERARIEIGSNHADETDPVCFVKDNGAGFDMQYSDKLFGVFQRLQELRTLKEPGSACRLRSASSNAMAGTSGRKQRSIRARAFTLLCHSTQASRKRVQLVGRLVSDHPFPGLTAGKREAWTF